MALGILAAAALGQALVPQYQNYAARTRGRYQSSLMEGVDQSDPNQTRNALFGGGLLRADQFQADARSAFEGEAQRANAIQRANIGAAAGLQNAALNRAKWAVDPLNPESPTYGQMTPYQQATLDIQRQNADTARMNADRQQMALDYEVLGSMGGPQVPEALVPDVQQYGPSWLEMAPEDRLSVKNAEDRVTTMENIVDYVTNTNAADRAANRGLTNQLAAEYQRTVLPYMQTRFQAGAMQQAELELFEAMAGDPFAYNQFSSSEQRKVVSLLNEMRADLSNQYSAYGLQAPAQQSPTQGLVAGPAPMGAAVGPFTPDMSTGEIADALRQYLGQ